MREEWEQQEGWKIDRYCSGSGGQCSVEPTSGVLDIINNMLEMAWSSYKITLYGDDWKMARTPRAHNDECRRTVNGEKANYDGWMLEWLLV